MVASFFICYYPYGANRNLLCFNVIQRSNVIAPNDRAMT